MFGFLSRIAIKGTANEFIKSHRVVDTTLFTELRKEYSQEMPQEKASVLAAQVVNFLTAQDIDEVIANAEEPLRKQIIDIKDQIEIRGHEKLQKDREARELVVYTLRMKTVIQFGLIGEPYMTSAEKQRIDKILTRYGAEFTKEAEPKTYAEMVYRYYQERFGEE